MREHLFRGFHPNKNGTTKITLNGEKIKGYWVEGLPFGRIGGGLTPHGINSLRADKDRKVYSVFPKTVCEYTGLTDKNSKKIFDGHIVKAKSLESGKEAVYLVCFDDTSLWFGFKSPNSGYVHSLDDLLQKELGDEIDFEIVGNIYENAELLKRNALSALKAVVPKININLIKGD